MRHRKTASGTSQRLPRVAAPQPRAQRRAMEPPALPSTTSSARNLPRFLVIMRPPPSGAVGAVARLRTSASPATSTSMPQRRNVE